MRTIPEITAEITKISETCSMLKRHGLPTANLETMLNLLGTELVSATSVGAYTLHQEHTSVSELKAPVETAPTLVKETLSTSEIEVPVEPALTEETPTNPEVEAPVEPALTEETPTNSEVEAPVEPALTEETPTNPEVEAPVETAPTQEAPTNPEVEAPVETTLTEETPTNPEVEAPVETAPIVSDKAPSTFKTKAATGATKGDKDVLKAPQGTAQAQEAWLDMRERDWDKQETSGENLMCGTCALAISIIGTCTDMGLYTVWSVEKLQEFLNNLLNSKDYEGAAANRKAQVDPEDVESLGLDAKEFLSLDQLAILVQLLSDTIGTSLHLAVWQPNSVYLTTNDDEQLVWVHLDNAHWSGVANPADLEVAAVQVNDDEPALLKHRTRVEKYLSLVRNPEDVDMKSALIPLLSPKTGSKVWESVKPLQKRKAFLCVNDGLLPNLGNTSSHDWNGINLYWQFVFRDVAPCIRISFVVYQASKVVHSGFVEFYLGDVYGKGRQFYHFEHRYVVVENNQDRAELTWKTDGGIPSNIHLPPSLANCNQKVTDTLAALRSYLQPSEVKMILQARGRTETKADLRRLLRTLPAGGTYDQIRYKPWAPYCRLSGEPQLQYNTEVSRQALIQQGLPMHSYPARNIFIDPREAEIKLNTGIIQEHHFQANVLKELAKHSHWVTFLRCGPHILAKVRFGKWPALGETRLRIEDKTQFKISWTTSSSDKKLDCVGVSVANIFGIGGANLVLIISSEEAKSFNDTAIKFGTVNSINEPESSPQRPCKLIPVANDMGTKRQVHAVHSLCNVTEPIHNKWWTVLQNQQLSQEPTRNPLHVQPDEKTIKAATDFAQALLPWNKEQRDALDNATAMVGGVMLVQGAAGTGKTAVEVALAKKYLRAGLHVLMTAPSHSAADEIVEKHMKLGPVHVQPIRVYPPAQEKLHLLSSDSSTKPADIEEDSSETAEFDTTLLAVIDEIKSSHRKRAFRLREFSLEEQVREVARKGSRKLVRAYGVADDEEPGPEVDMWEELRGFLDKIGTTPLGQWEDIDRRNFGKAYKYTKRDLISAHRLVVTTTNTSVCEDIRATFGDNALGIVVIEDEAAMEQEPNAWCPLIKLENHAKVQGWVMVGDNLQLPPTVISANTTPGYNEHAPTLSNALFSRLQNANFPTVTLREQNRMHEVLSEWPNLRTYRGQLRNGNMTHGRLDPELAKLMGSYLGISKEVEKEDKNESRKRLHFLNVVNGICQINPDTTSRYNTANVKIVIEFIRKLWSTKIIPRLTARLITPYKDQVRLYEAEYMDLERQHRIPRSELPIISTIDGAQAKEADVVIFDSVVSSGERKQDLGFLLDDRRLNVACTRAKEVFLLVGNLEVTRGSMIEKWNENKGTSIGDDDDTLPNPKPYLVGYIEFLQKRNAVTYMKAKDVDDLPKVLQTGDQEQAEGWATADTDSSQPPVDPQQGEWGGADGGDRSSADVKADEWGGAGPDVAQASAEQHSGNWGGIDDSAKSGQWANWDQTANKNAGTWGKWNAVAPGAEPPTDW